MMNIWRPRFYNSLFSRLVITFLIIMVPIYILGIFIYQWGLNTVKSEISKSTVAQASFYLEGLENEIERIKTLQYDCLNDVNLNKLAIRWDIMDQYDIVEAISLLHQKLITIKNSSEYIEDVSVHIYPIQETISSGSWINDFDLERYENIRVPAGLNGAQIISYEGGLYLSTLQAGNYSTDNPLYLIEIKLNMDALRQTLSQFTTYEDSGSYLISHAYKNIIISQEENLLFTEQTVESFINSGYNQILSYNIGNNEYYIVLVDSSYLDMALLRYIPKEFIQTPLNNFYIWVWVFTLSAFCIIIIYSYYVYKLMHKPMLKLVNSFEEVEKGNLHVSIDIENKNEFGYLYKRFNEMTRNLRMLIDQVYNQKILMHRAELKQLQSQINPHFLYNSFFMLNTMIRINDENLIPFTKYLGEYFRYITRNASDYMPLIDEINHAKVYTSIQLIRFPRRFEINFDEFPEQYVNFMVPRLIIQPIIENAFEHGIGKKNSDGFIRVRFGVHDKGLTIMVEDNGNDLSDKELNDLQDKLKYTGNEIEVTGILNINRRIKLVFGEESGLNISRSELGGLKVMLKVEGGGDHLQAHDS